MSDAEGSQASVEEQNMIAPARIKPIFLQKRLKDVGAQEEDHPDLQQSSAWLLSFTDIIALLLTFFVMLYAMADHNPVKGEGQSEAKISGEVRQLQTIAEKGQPQKEELTGGNGYAGPEDTISLPKISRGGGQDVSYLEETLREGVQKISKEAFVGRSGESLLLLFPAKMVKGGAQVQQLAAGVAPLMRNRKNQLEIIGIGDVAYTDLYAFKETIKGEGSAASYGIRSGSYDYYFAQEKQKPYEKNWIGIAVRPARAQSKNYVVLE